VDIVSKYINLKKSNMKILYLLLIFSFLVACKKNVTEDNITGTFTLDAVKQIKTFSRNRIEHPFLGGVFVFEANKNVKCYANGDTLYGTYQIESRNGRNRDENGPVREKCLFLRLVNRNNTNFINWQLWKVIYRNDRKELVGELERSGCNQFFEFNRQ
jgi:hypothetical protein